MGKVLDVLAARVATLLVFVLFFVTPSFASQIVEDVSGSADLDFVDRFAGSGIVRYQQEENAAYVMAAGKVKRIDGVWRAEQEKTLHGRLTSLTYRAFDRQSARGVYAYFIDQFEALGLQALYRCKGLDCGNSNKWANKVFMEKRLYGPDPQQYYYAGRLDNLYVALYVIKRGNKRVYARLDAVALEAGEAQGLRPAALDEVLQDVDSSSAYAQLINNRHVVLDKLQKQQGRLFPVAQLGFLKELVSGMRDTDGRLRVVAHYYADEPVNVLIEQSEKDAKYLLDYLVEQGLSSQRLESFGVGPLAPASKRGEFSSAEQGRLELFLLPD